MWMQHSYNIYFMKTCTKIRRVGVGLKEYVKHGQRGRQQVLCNKLVSFL